MVAGNIGLVVGESRQQEVVIAALGLVGETGQEVVVVALELVAVTAEPVVAVPLEPVVAVAFRPQGTVVYYTT